MTSSSAERIGDVIILVARILVVVLFVVFGWSKLSDYSGTAGYMAQVGAPIPSVAALVAIAVEFFVARAVIFRRLDAPAGPPARALYIGKLR